MFAGLCDVGLDDMLSKASITYKTVLPAVCRDHWSRAESKGVFTHRENARKEGTEVTALN